MESEGFTVHNTGIVDLDLDTKTVVKEGYDIVTAFEIFEHLVNPFSVVNSLVCTRLFASVPLSLWFAKAYWNEDDPWDRHYHEFEPRQFDMLLEKAGWTIVDSEKWISKSDKIGFRPLLRRFYPRYYIVFCERK